MLFMGSGLSSDLTAPDDSRALLFCLLPDRSHQHKLAPSPNLWAQSGTKARDTAILGGALAGYNRIVASSLPLMATLFGRGVRMPSAPKIPRTTYLGRLKD